MHCNTYQLNFRLTFCSYLSYLKRLTIRKCVSYVRFHIKAPKADSVRVTLGLGGRGSTKLTKGTDSYSSNDQIK